MGMVSENIEKVIGTAEDIGKGIVDKVKKVVPRASEPIDVTKKPESFLEEVQIDKSKRKVELVTDQEETVREQEDLDKSFTDYITLNTADPEYKSTIQNVGDFLTKERTRKEIKEDKTAPIKNFPFDKPQTSLLEKISKYGLKQQPILKGGEDFNLSEEIDEKAFKRKTAYEKVMERVRRSKAKNEKQHNPVENLQEIDDVWHYTDFSGNVNKFEAESKEKAEKIAVAIDDKLRRIGAAFYRDASEYSESFNSQVFRAQGDVGLIAKAVKRQAPREYYRNFRNITDIMKKNPSGFVANSLAPSQWAWLETLVESPITMLGPALIGTVGPSVADTVDMVFGEANPVLKLYADVGNMSLENEMLRFSYSPNLRMYDQNVSWTDFDKSFSFGTNPNEKSITPEGLLSNKERMKNRPAPALHRIVPRFISDYALTLGILFPFKKAAKAYAQGLQDQAIDKMGYKLSKDGKSYVLKKTPKGRLSDKPARLDRTQVFLEMQQLHKEDILKEAKGLSKLIPGFIKRITKEQKMMYGTDPVGYLKSVRSQVAGENVFIGLFNMMTGDGGSLFNKENWAASGTNMMFEFISAGVGNVAGAAYTKFNVTGRVIDGIKYPFFKVADFTHDITGQSEFFKFIPKLLAPSGFNPKRDLSPQQYVEYKKLDPKALGYFKKMARDIAIIRKENPALAIEMNKSYEYYLQLRKDLIDANARVPKENRFDENDLNATLGSIFQLRGLNIMRAQLISEMDKSAMSKLDTSSFVKNADIAGRQSEALQNILKNQLENLDVMTADQSNQAINILKEMVQKTYDTEIVQAQQTNALLAKAVRIKLSQELFDLDLDEESAEFIEEIVNEHSLLKDDDVKEVVQLNKNTKVLRDSIAKNYIAGVHNQRKKLTPVIAPKKNIVSYNIKAYDDKGGLIEEDGIMSIVNKNIEAANTVINQSSQNGLDIVNNIFRHFKLHYGGLYDKITKDLSQVDKNISMTDLLVEVNDTGKITRAIGKKQDPVNAELQKITDDIVNVQLEAAYETAWNSTAKAAQEAGQEFTQKLGSFKKEIKEEIINELNLSGENIGRLNKIDELQNLKDNYDLDFNITGSYRQLASLKKTVNSAIQQASEKNNVDRVKVLEKIKKTITQKQNDYAKYLEKNVENGREIAKNIRTVDQFYRANVGAKGRKSKILQFLERQGESVGDVVAREDLASFRDTDLVTGLKVKTPKDAIKFTAAEKQEKLFDWIFDNIKPENMEEELSTIFGVGTVKATPSGGEKVIFEQVVESSPGYPAYKAFLENYEMWAAAKVAKMLDESVAQGGTKIGNTIMSADPRDVGKWKEINKAISQGDEIGQALFSEDNKKLLKRMKAFENSTGGQMKIGRDPHFEQLQQWMLNNDKLAEGFSQVLKMHDKVLDNKLVNIEKRKVLQMRVIRGLELEADTFKNLNDPQQFFMFAMQNKKGMKKARDAAVKAGVDPTNYDNMVKSLLIKALIQRRTIGTVKGKMKYETVSDNVAANDLARKNGMNRNKIKTIDVKVKGSDEKQKMLMGTHKELDGIGMVEDIEEYGESLAEYFGENSAVLEHFKLIVDLASFVDQEAAMKTIKGGKFARGVTLSIPMMQSRLWAIMSKRASYHYALSEGLLAFANGRNLDTAYAFLNADAEVSGAMAKMLATGETKFSAKLDPKLAIAFYADTVVGLQELNEGYKAYLKTQDPYRKLLNVLFELSPDKSPEGLFPSAKESNNKIFGRNTWSLKDDVQVQDNNLLANRRAYFQEISKRFVEKLKQGPEVNKDMTIEDIFNRAFEEYQAQSTTFTP